MPENTGDRGRLFFKSSTYTQEMKTIMDYPRDLVVVLCSYKYCQPLRLDARAGTRTAALIA